MKKKLKKTDSHEALIDWLNLNSNHRIGFTFFLTNFRITNEEYIGPNGEVLDQDDDNHPYGSYCVKVKYRPWTFFGVLKDNFQKRHLPLFSTTRLLEVKRHLKQQIKYFDENTTPSKWSHRHNPRQRNTHHLFLMEVDRILLTRNEPKAQLGAILE